MRTARFSVSRAAIALATIALPASLPAQTPPKARASAFQDVINCRAIADATARLACFDAKVAALDTAETNADVVIVDKAQVKKARRSLFGFTLPSLDIFGSGKKDEATAAADREQDESIESTISKAYRAPGGAWVMIIEDGAKWVQIDQKDIRPPQPGQAIRIRKAAMGSFFANVEKFTGFRVKREN